MPGGRLTQEDRRRIAAWLTDGLSHAEIGRRLSRPTSTITREVNRNRGPAGYQADQAQRATRQRARRRGTLPPAPEAAPADPPAYGRDGAAVAAFEQRFTDVLVQMGLPRMLSRVLTCLTTADSGGMTSAELVRRLQVSPASISKAIGWLEDQQLVRRERDGRRERYVVDDDVWYRASIASGHTNKMLAEAALDGASVLGPDTPAGARLGDTGRFLKAFTEDLLSRAEHWHAVFTGRGQAGAGEQPPQDDNADRVAAGGRS
jgi:DNA-binding transcriptional ArsR family regulator